MKPTSISLIVALFLLLSYTPTVATKLPNVVRQFPASCERPRTVRLLICGCYVAFRRIVMPPNNMPSRAQVLRECRRMNINLRRLRIRICRPYVSEGRVQGNRLLRRLLPAVRRCTDVLS